MATADTAASNIGTDTTTDDPCSTRPTWAGPRTTLREGVSPARAKTPSPTKRSCMIELDGQLLLVQEYLRRQLSGRPIAPLLAVAWRAFYGRYLGTIRRFVGSCGLTGEDLEDCVQEVWISVLKKLPELQFDASRGRLDSCLYTIVRRRLVDHLRRLRRQAAESLEQMSHRQLVAASRVVVDSFSGGDNDRESLAVVLAALRVRVSETSYQVFYLRRVEGRSVADVARILGLAPPQVRARAHRVEQKQLLAVLAGYMPSARRYSSLKNSSRHPHRRLSLSRP